MLTLAAWKEKQAKAVQTARGIMDKAKLESREPSSDEASLANVALDESDLCQKEIDKLNSGAALQDRLNAASKILEEPKGRKTPVNSSSIIFQKDLVMDDPKKGFKSPRHFMHAVLNAGRNARSAPENLKLMAAINYCKNEQEREAILQATAGSDEQGVYSDPFGGFLVPEGFSPEIMRMDPDADPMAGRTRQLPMQSPTVKFNARVDKDHTSSVSGGLIVTRSAETLAKATSRQQYEQIQINADSLFGGAYATEEILTDSPVSFAALIAAGFSDEFTSKLIQERLEGTGVGEYMGILKSPCLLTVSKEGSQAADTVLLANLYKMRARIWGYKDAVWIANQTIIPQLAALNQPVSTAGGQVVYMPSAREDIPDMLLGRPLIYSEYASAIGDVGDLILGNWTQYLEGIYQPLQSAESIHVRFLNHERAYKFWMRCGGAPWWKTVLTPKKGATMSPFVVLEAR